LYLFPRWHTGVVTRTRFRWLPQRHFVPSRAVTLTPCDHRRKMQLELSAATSK
jgi:hypothetical protein